MLAMVVNDDEGYLNARVVLAFFASMLAPTGDWVHSRKSGRLAGAKIKRSSERGPNLRQLLQWGCATCAKAGRVSARLACF